MVAAVRHTPLMAMPHSRENMHPEDKNSRRRKLNEDERALWDTFTRSVQPLARRGNDLAPPPSPPHGSAPAARPRRAETRAPRPTPAARVEPVERRQHQRLARGIDAIAARLDLHGRTQSEAYVELLAFLRRAQRNGAKFVLVITGKGTPSRENAMERGVLRRQVPLWLNLPELRAYVASVGQAHSSHGGAGALYVRLRRKRRTG